jgi:hypothetical protein
MGFRDRAKSRKLLELRKQSIKKYCRGDVNLEASGWEKLICKYLSETKMYHRHNSPVFCIKLKNGKPITYTPDIIVNDIIIEPHAVINDSFIQKMRAFKEFYPDELVILVTENAKIPSALSYNIFDDVVPIEYYDLLASIIQKLSQTDKQKNKSLGKKREKEKIRIKEQELLAKSKRRAKEKLLKEQKLSLEDLKLVFEKEDKT